MVYEPSDRATISLAHPATNLTLILLPGKNLRVTMQYNTIEENSPLPLLHDLATDDKFKRKLVIDVTERLFFSTLLSTIKEPAKRVAYFKKRTPVQKFSFLVTHQLEERFVFLNKDHLSLSAILDYLPIKKRPGVFAYPRAAHKTLTSVILTGKI